MENMVTLNYKHWKNQKVLVTGHTGFKGKWLIVLLKHLGAKVYGISKDKYDIKDKSFLKKFDNKNFFYFNLKDKKKTIKIINEIKPNFIFHFAAQSLVKKSYDMPYLTFDENIHTTLNFLEICRTQKQLNSLMITTTDKCYENLNKKTKFKENDKLGGTDPYSASKSACELMIQAYLNSFYKYLDISLFSVRAGNVVGGGDWSENRLIPDMYRCLSQKKPLILRYPSATRPWQHVLDLLIGYLSLTENASNNLIDASGAFNFGPNSKTNKSVRDLIIYFKKNYFHTLKLQVKKNTSFKKESIHLNLDSRKIQKTIGFKNTFNIDKTLKLTGEWYSKYLDHNKNTYDLINNQITQNVKY